MIATITNTRIGEKLRAKRRREGEFSQVTGTFASAHVLVKEVRNFHCFGTVARTPGASGRHRRQGGAARDADVWRKFCAELRADTRGELALSPAAITSW